MSQSLSTRLRSLASEPKAALQNEVVNEAADELDRLAAANHKLLDLVRNVRANAGSWGALRPELRTVVDQLVSNP